MKITNFPKLKEIEVKTLKEQKNQNSKIRPHRAIDIPDMNMRANF